MIARMECRTGHAKASAEACSTFRIQESRPRVATIADLNKIIAGKSKKTTTFQASADCRPADCMCDSACESAPDVFVQLRGVRSGFVRRSGSANPRWMRFCGNVSCSSASEVESGPAKLPDLVFTCVLARPMNVPASGGSRIGSMNDAQSFLFWNNSLLRLISMLAISFALRDEHQARNSPEARADVPDSSEIQCTAIWSDRIPTVRLTVGPAAAVRHRGALGRSRSVHGGKRRRIDATVFSCVAKRSRPNCGEPQNGLDQITIVRKTVLTRLRLCAKRS